MDFDREIDIKLNNNARSYVDYYVSFGLLSGNGRVDEIGEELALSKIYDIKN